MLELNQSGLQQQYRKSKKRLFLFDYDGTLTPIISDPAAAVPSSKLVKSLRILIDNPSNTIYVISGRDQSFLSKHFDNLNQIGLIAEHGCFVRIPGEHEWENLAASLDMSWQKEVEATFQYFTDLTPGSWVERKKAAMTWHYRAAEQNHAKLQASRCKKRLEEMLTKDSEVEIISGKCNVEVRPKSLNKGNVISRFISPTSYETTPINTVWQPPDFVLCIGDDETDEDMFRTLSHSKLDPDRVFTCHVGASTQPTLAKTYLAEPADVINALISLVESADDVREGNKSNLT